jgi:hypothetical protein
MAFCVGIRTHVIRGTIVRIPECLSHFAIEKIVKNLFSLSHSIVLFHLGITTNDQVVFWPDLQNL